MKRLVYYLGWLLGDNNGRCLALWIITSVLLAMAIFSGFGKPVFTSTLEKKIYEISQSTKYHQSVYEAWYGPKRAKAKARGEKWPTVKKWPSLAWSWKWWFGFFLFFLISLIYTPIAFRKEMREFFSKSWRKIREKKDTEAKTKKENNPASSTVKERKTTEGWKSSFTRLFSIALGAEVAWELIQKILVRIIRRR